MPMDLPTTVTAALALGAAGSLHCFVMCGPLACAAQRGPRRAATAMAYHGARIVAYAAVGALLGAAGDVVRLPLQGALPWLLAAVLLAAVVDPGGKRLRRLRPLPGITQILQLAAGVRAKLSPMANAALLGALTPLLPCGLVYGIGAAAIATSSAAGGALLMGGFAWGAVPALLLAQGSMAWLGRLPRIPAALVQRGLPLLAAGVLLYRATMATTHHACH
jgi:sulfite exporter TauE/SafE